MRAAAVLAILLLAGEAAAKAPTLDRLFPPGAQRGETVRVTASGSFDHWPVQCWTDRPGVNVLAEKEKGKLVISVEAEAEAGVYWLRLFDEEGATALRPFVVGTLPEIVESEPKEGPQAIESPRITINGRLGKRGDVDEFTVPLKKGETLVASVDANRDLGSPMDAVLQVATPEGFVLAQNDDDQGLDPRLAFQAPSDGTYHVRLFAFPAVTDSTIAFAGGEAFVYRLTLTTGGFLEYGYPLAVARANPGQVEIHGWNVPEEAKHLTVKADAALDFAALAHPGLANVGEVRLEPHATLVEQEPSRPDRPQEIAVPVTVTGRINPERDRDVFEFAARKGQTLVFRLEARSLGSPLDPVLRLIDAAGKTLAEVDDTGKGRDAEHTFAPPADAKYRLVVRDLHGLGGPSYVYRLVIAQPEPDYQLTLADDRFTLKPGQPLSIPVAIERKNGFAGVVEIHVEGLPERFEASPARSEPKGNTSRSVTITVRSKDGRAASVPIRLVGKTTEGPARERTARAPIAGFEASTSQAWLTVLKPAEKPKTGDDKKK